MTRAQHQDMTAFRAVEPTQQDPFTPVVTIELGTAELNGNLTGNDTHRRQQGQAAITLLTRGALLSQFAPVVRRKALTKLRQLDICVMEHVGLATIEERTLRLTNDERLVCDFLFPAVGTRPSSLIRAAGLATDAHGGLLVNRYLEGAFLEWAVVGTFGDNLKDTARSLAKPLGLSGSDLALLEELGTYINYNGYGPAIDDLQAVPRDVCAPWFPAFERGEAVRMPDIPGDPTFSGKLSEDGDVVTGTLHT